MSIRARLLIAAAAILFCLAASCPSNPNPNPSPGPSSSPTPKPTPPWPSPSPGGPIQFGIANGKWIPKSPFGFVGCCATPARDGALGWTFAEPTEIDAYASAGGTLAVFRTGPYSDQGNGWGMIQASPGQDSRLRLACKLANAKGIACLVEAGTDHWSLKSGNKEFQLYNDDCSITRQAPLPRYQRWSREVVHQVGDLKVLWSLGNEGWLCSPTREWYDGLVNTIRQAESDFGFPRHPIGNVYQAAQVGSILYDFVEVHGSPEEFCAQQDVGVPVIWTESGNEAPPESNERMLAAKTCADASGGKKATLLWRGGIQDQQWGSLFASLGGRPPQVGPRVDSSCLWNKYEQTYGGKLNDNMDEATLLRMKQAVENVIAGGYSWLFTNNGNNLVSTGTPDDDYQRIDYFSLLVAYLAPGCTIAGNPDAGNSFSEVDNIELQIQVDPCAQSGQYIGWHPIIFGNPGNFNQVMRGDQLRQSPSVFKGRNQWNVTSPCTGGPTPGPSPTPSPLPSPAPTPPTQSCGALGGDICNQGNMECPASHNPVVSDDCNPCCVPKPAEECLAEQSDINKWRVIVKSNPANQQVDLTPVACGNIVNIPGIHNPGPNCVELSAEKGNQACSDKLYGMPVWMTSGTISLVQVYEDNTFTMKVNPIPPANPGSGTVSACGKATASCVQFQARGAAPACDIVTPPPGVPGQGCVTPKP